MVSVFSFQTLSARISSEAYDLSNTVVASARIICSSYFSESFVCSSSPVQIFTFSSYSFIHTKHFNTLSLGTDEGRFPFKRDISLYLSEGRCRFMRETSFFCGVCTFCRYSSHTIPLWMITNSLFQSPSSEEDDEVRNVTIFGQLSSIESPLGGFKH